MVIRRRPLTKDEWNSRITELLIDIAKESDEYCDKIFELAIDRALDFRDERRNDTEDDPISPTAVRRRRKIGDV